MRPIPIRSTGPIPAMAIVAIPIAFLIDSGSPLNASAILVIISIAGVATFKNASPIGAIASLSCSRDA